VLEGESIVTLGNGNDSQQFKASFEETNEEIWSFL